MYICLGLVAPPGEDVVFDNIVFVFAGTRVQASPRGWKTHA